LNVVICFSIAAKAEFSVVLSCLFCLAMSSDQKPTS